MTVRTQRAARQESAALAKHVHDAGVEFDKARATPANRLFARLGSDPASGRRRLLATLEGVDRLIGGLWALRTDLAGDEVVWYLESTTKVALYGGELPGADARSRGYWLVRALEGDLGGLDPAEYAHLESLLERQMWAAEELAAFFDAEVARLRAHRATLDHEAIAQARAEAEHLALFDPGKEATLARKYESASTRTLFQFLQGFHAVEVGNATDLLDPAEPELAPADDQDSALEADENEIRDEANNPIPLTIRHLERGLGSFEPADDDETPLPSAGSVTGPSDSILPRGAASPGVSRRRRAHPAGRS